MINLNRIAPKRERREVEARVDPVLPGRYDRASDAICRGDGVGRYVARHAARGAIAPSARTRPR
jgi:hypothetical protein